MLLPNLQLSNFNQIKRKIFLKLYLSITIASSVLGKFLRQLKYVPKRGLYIR